MMMHKGMHDMEGNHGSHRAEQTTNKNTEESKDASSQKKAPEPQAKSKKTSKVLLIIGGIGMGLMMLLMFIV